MRIHKDGRTIANLADWEKLAGPKIASQWVEGRSAYEVANAWCGLQGPAVPVDFRRLLESRKETAGLEIDEVLPEHRIRFDNNAGEPRDADLAIIGRVGRSGWRSLSKPKRTSRSLRRSPALFQSLLSVDSDSPAVAVFRESNISHKRYSRDD